MAIVRFNPMSEVMNLQREMNRFVDSFLSPASRDTGEGPASAVWRPVVDIHEDDNGYIIEAELPGMSKDQVSINYQDGVLTLSGERRYAREEEPGRTEEEESGKVQTGRTNGNGNGHSKEKGISCHRMERFYGKFYRSFSFPSAVDPDNINAKFDGGVLTVTVPKAEVVKPRRIEIG